MTITGAAVDTGVAGATGAGGARAAITAPTASTTVAAVVAGTAAVYCAADEVTDRWFTGEDRFLLFISN